MSARLDDKLSMASIFGYSKTMEKLLERGANPNAVDIHGWTPLLWASKNGHAEAVRSLLDHGAILNVYNTDDGVNDQVTALHVAAKEGHVDVVKVLCDQGAEVNYKDDEGRTPLHYAVLSRNQKIIHLLFNEGADQNIMDMHGKTPMDLARQWGEREMVNLLWEKASYRNDSFRHIIKQIQKAEIDAREMAIHMDNKKIEYQAEIDRQNEIIADLERNECQN